MQLADDVIGVNFLLTELVKYVFRQSVEALLRQLRAALRVILRREREDNEERVKVRQSHRAERERR